MLAYPGEGQVSIRQRKQKVDGPASNMAHNGMRCARSRRKRPIGGAIGVHPDRYLAAERDWRCPGNHLAGHADDTGCLTLLGR